MAGEIRTFYYVVFPDARKQVLSDRRTVRFDTYYVAKNNDAAKEYQASHMTLALAEKIAEIYKTRSPIVKSDTDHDFGDSPLKHELWEVGESEVPAKPEPGSIGRLEDAVRAAMADLPKPEVLNIVGRILLQ